MKKLTRAQSKQHLVLGLTLGDNEELRHVPIEDLQVDTSYQRAIVPSTIDKIRGDEYNEQALGIFTVCERAKTHALNLVDGQNRWKGICSRKENELPYPKTVLCRVVKNTTREEEAALFVTLNTCRPVTGNSKFRARLVWGEEPEVTIEKWAKLEGFELDFLPPGTKAIESARDNGLYSLTWLLSAWNRCQDQIRPALQLLKEATGIKKGSQLQKAKSVPCTLRKGEVVYGLGLFLKMYGCTDVKAVAKDIRHRHIDLTALWEEVKKEEATGWKRCTTFAESLADWLGYGSKVIRRKAA